MTISPFVAALVSYLVASIPFSVLIGKLVLGKNIREYGDGNPGATNVRRAGGSIFWYLLAVILDAFKGLIPTGIAFWAWGWADWRLILIASVAVIGHIFPIYTRFRGGKAVAITIGVWVGILAFEGFILLPLMITFWYRAVRESEWAVTLMMISLLAYLLLTRSSQSVLLVIWGIHMLLIVYKHRDGLLHPPTLRRAENTQATQQ
jgi:glycerol-3-phosphate acyltransferase PlsY